MPPSVHQNFWTGRALHAASFCVLAAVGGCSGYGSAGGAGGVAARSYSLGSTISGLNTSGLVLMVDAGRRGDADLFHMPGERSGAAQVLISNGTAVSVAAGITSLRLARSLPTGSSYSVTVQTQPTGETCSIASGSGTIQAANAANVVVTCSNQAYALGGSISGLNGAGLVLANGGDTLTVSSGASSFTMPSPVAYTSSYALSVQTQPAGLACAVDNGAGAMPAAAVTNVAITCTDQPFSLGGTISGLGNNAGLTLTNGADTLAVPAGSTGFTMPTAVAFGSAYSVAVQTAPPGLTCTASNAAATMPASNVVSVVIACSDQSYTVGGTISGFSSSGLVLVNGGDTLAVQPGASSFTMPAPVAFTSAYAVTVQTQPTGLTCSVSNGTGTMGSAAVTNIALTCSANTYTVGGTISGLTASGLVLLDNGGDATTLSANATQFTMNSGIAYGSALRHHGSDAADRPGVRGEQRHEHHGRSRCHQHQPSSAGRTSHLLYSFAGGSSDGAGPYHSLILGQRWHFLWNHPGRRRQQRRHDLQDHAERHREPVLLLRDACRIPV